MITLNTLFAFYHSWLFIYLIKIGGNVEENQGPKCYSVQYLTVPHWDLNGIAAHNLIKIALLKAYLTIHRMYIVSLSEI